MKNGKPVGVRMVRNNLDNIPYAELPQGFSFRYYQPGDEQVWYDMWVKSEKIAEISPDTFMTTYNAELPALAKRQVYIVNEQGDAVATSTAWMGENDRSDMHLGRVHWVAVVPEYQKKGLARPLLSKTLKILQNLGHTEAFLYSDTHRINALALYLKYDFQPCLNLDSEREAWAYVKTKLHPPVQSLVAL